MSYLDHHRREHADHYALRGAILQLAPDAVIVRMIPLRDRFGGWTAKAFDAEGTPIEVELLGELAVRVMQAKAGVDWDDPTRSWDLHVNSGIVRPAPEGGESR